MIFYCHSELWRYFTPKIGAVLLRTLAIWIHADGWLKKLKRGQGPHGALGDFGNKVNVDSPAKSRVFSSIWLWYELFFRQIA